MFGTAREPQKNRSPLLLESDVLAYSRAWLAETRIVFRGKQCPDTLSQNGFQAAPPFGFLLIICTHHIVTAFSKASSVGYSDFPANSQGLPHELLRGQATVLP